MVEDEAEDLSYDEKPRTRGREKVRSWERQARHSCTFRVRVEPSASSEPVVPIDGPANAMQYIPLLL